MRRLLGLEDVISLGLCAPVHDERSWTFDLDPDGRDPVLGYHRLAAAYFALDPARNIAMTAVAARISRLFIIEYLNIFALNGCN